MEQFQKIKPPERLIINTEVHPCVKRACATLDAIHQTRLQNMHARGIEHKAHMQSYDKESRDGKMDLINARLEYMMETASRTACLAEKTI